MLNNEIHLAIVNSPVRHIEATAELYNSSALLNTFSANDRIISFDVQRVGNSKFFGFGFCHRLNIHLIDIERELEITTDNYFKIYFNGLSVFPGFYVTEVNRDENTNELSVTAYDKLYFAAETTIADLGLIAPYSVEDVAAAIAQYLKLSLVMALKDDFTFGLVYEDGANFDGAETLTEALNAISDITQSIYFINAAGALEFKRLDKDGTPVATIDKSKYFTLSSKTNRRLSAICAVNNLGDNVTATLDLTGTTHYIRDNAFIDMREDKAAITDYILSQIGNLTINQFECNWRGNYLLEIGDKIALTTKDGGLVYSYLLDDTLSYNGTLNQVTRWEYTDDEAETAENPTNLGDALKQTFAKVDKANKEVEILVSSVEENETELSNLRLDTQNISAVVSNTQQALISTSDSLNKEIANLTKEVEAKVDSETLQILVKNELEQGAQKVTTTTGFTFDEEGLKVSKSESEITTTISEDGMSVHRENKEVLRADNLGVKAEDLHATTFLIIGKNSRLEDYDNSRTGCFWIGG